MRHPHRHGNLEQALALVGESKTPRLDRLYQDARSTWLALPKAGERMDALHKLVMALLHETVEVDAGDDAQIRSAYEIKGAA